eukprot:597347-Alexandrium_andersonii.AAC.1
MCIRDRRRPALLREGGGRTERHIGLLDRLGRPGAHRGDAGRLHEGDRGHPILGSSCDRGAPVVW